MASLQSLSIDKLLRVREAALALAVKLTELDYHVGGRRGSASSRSLARLLEKKIAIKGVQAAIVKRLAMVENKSEFAAGISKLRGIYDANTIDSMTGAAIQNATTSKNLDLDEVYRDWLKTRPNIDNATVRMFRKALAPRTAKKKQ